MTTLKSDSRSAMIAAAVKARRNAYAPYSHFQVGAAVLCESGDIVAGCNVENAVYGLSCCAERVAVCTAIAANRGAIIAVAIAAAPQAPPCGPCRQFLAEFNLQMEVISVDVDSGAEKSWRLAELLPDAFRLPK